MKKQADIEDVDLRSFCQVLPIKVPETIFDQAAGVSESGNYYS